MHNPNDDLSLERRRARSALLRARAAIDEALDELGRSAPVPSAAEPLMSPPRSSASSPPTFSALSSGDPPLTMEDLDLGVLEEVTASLPAVFDTYHVVEHPDFRRAHAHLLERPALNQLAGKVLRRNAPVLLLAYLGPRGRRRSALWQRQTV